MSATTHATSGLSWTGFHIAQCLTSRSQCLRPPPPTPKPAAPSSSPPPGGVANPASSTGWPAAPPTGGGGGMSVSKMANRNAAYEPARCGRAHCGRVTEMASSNPASRGVIRQGAASMRAGIRALLQTASQLALLLGCVAGSVSAGEGSAAPQVPTSLISSEIDGVTVTGTGVWIGTDALLTARHVVSLTSAVHARLPSGEWRLVNWVQAEDARRDQIVLRVTLPSVSNPARLRGTEYPGSLQVSLQAETAEGRVTRDGRLFKGIRRQMSSGGVQLRTSVHGTPGFSGAPLLDANHEVVAMFGTISNTGRSFAIPVDSPPPTIGRDGMSINDWQKERSGSGRGGGMQLLQMAGLRAARGEWKRVLVLLDGAGALCPDDDCRGRALELRGAAQFRVGDASAGRRTLRTAAELRPEDPGAWLTLGWFELEGGTAEAAESSFKRAAGAAPLDAEAAIGMAWSYRRRGLFSEALECYRTAATLEPWSEDVCVGLGNVLLHLSKPLEALEVLRPFAQSSPDSADAWFFIARAATSMGDRGLAEEATRRVRALSPSLAALLEGSSKAR